MWKLTVKIFVSLTIGLLSSFSLAQQCFSFKYPLTSLKKNILLPADLSTKKNNDNGFYFGANLGLYFANSHTASYYNGSDINSVDSTITYSINYQQIKQLLNDYDFSLAELPVKMHYSPAFLLGVYVKYTIENSGIVMQFNFSRLKANDIFTISVDDPTNFSSDPVYKQESIWGIEQRASIDLGYSYTFNPKSNYRPFVQFGANLTDTKYIDNKINIEGLEYSITNYYYSYQKIEQGGVGFGAFAGGGMNLIFSESISIMPTLNIYYTQAKMGELIKPRFNYTFFISVILNGIL
ncbi:MAG: hypothetical protein V1904_06285 [Bacteroidota bacterium]